MDSTRSCAALEERSDEAGMAHCRPVGRALGRWRHDTTAKSKGIYANANATYRRREVQWQQTTEIKGEEQTERRT